MPNQWDRDVPYSAEELHRLYHDEGMSQREIAERFGIRQTTVSRHMKRAGINSRLARARDQSGPKNQNWKGGRIRQAMRLARPNIKDSGYWYIWKPDHPNATKVGYVAEHVAVGAPEGLAPGECVHHINLRKHDNRPENLVRLTRQRHADMHAQLGMIAGELVERGLITFDTEGGYRLTL
jgi:hypothetical protein